MEKSMSVWKRLLAVLMVFALLIGNFPMGVAAEETEPEEPVAAALMTSITEGMVFALNETTDFAYGTIPNDDAGKLVKGRFEITDGDGAAVDMAAVAKLEYLEVQSGNWFEFYGDFGPATGFPMMEATSSFRITFKQAGDYKVTVSMVTVEDGTVLCSDVKNVKAEYVAPTVTVSGLGASAVGRTTNFTVTTEANSEAGIMVKGSFVIVEGSELINIADVAKLEYQDSETGTWNVFAGEYGPDAGFRLTNATSNFRVTFLKTGTYDVSVFVKNLEGVQVCDPATVSVPVTYAPVTFSGVESDKWYNADQIVTVTMDAPGLTDAAQLPEVTVTEGCGTIGGWTLVEGKWTNDVTVTATATVSCNGQSIQVKIDKDAPEIDTRWTYSFASRKKTYIYVTAEDVGESGIAVILINGKQLTKNDRGFYELDGVANSVTVEVIDKAGNRAVYNTNGVQPDLEIDFSEPKIEAGEGGTIGDVTYVKSGTSIGITVKNTDDGMYKLDTEKSTVAGAAAEWVNNTTTYVIPEEGMNVLKVYVQDAMGRTATEELKRKYAIGDANAPEISIGDPVEGKKGSYTITVTVKDADGNLAPGQGTLVLTYDKTTTTGRGPGKTTKTETVTIDFNGKNMGGWTSRNGGYAYAIKVENGVTVSNIQVVAVDNTGLRTEVGKNQTTIGDTEAPTIWAEFVEGNVESFYEKSEGEWFAVVDPTSFDNYYNLPEEQEASTVTLRVYVADQNITMDESWTYVAEEEYWYKDMPTVVVNAHETAQMEISFSATDLKGNVAKDKVTVAANVQKDERAMTSAFDIYADEDGNYTATLNFDRRAPGSTGVVSVVPTIVLTDDFVDELGSGIYNKAFTFTAEIDDEVYVEETVVDENGEETTIIKKSGNSAGIKSVEWTLTDGMNGKLFKGEGRGNKAGTYEISVDPGALKGETNCANVMIVVTDVLGNTFTYLHQFCFDNDGPRITVTFDNNTANEVDGEFYFQNVRKATVNTLELNYDGILVNGEEMWGDLVGGYDVYVPFETEGLHTLAIEATDKAGNAAVVTYEGVAPQKFFVDLNNPDVSVGVTCTGTFNTDQVIDFHNGQVQFAVELKDEFMEEVSATVIFEDDTTQTVTLTNETEGNLQEVDEDIHTGTYPLPEGKVVKDFVVNATDKSGRTSQWQHTVDGTQKNLVVDTTVPTITVTKSQGNYVQTYDHGEATADVDYYNGTVTYTVSVKDLFLNAGVGTAELVLEFSNEETTVINLFDHAVEQEEGALIAAEDCYEYSFEVTDGRTLNDIKIKVSDNAGNANSACEWNDEEGKTAFTFDEETGYWDYSGNFVVVDTVAPVATLTFSDNVKTFFIRNNTVYMELTKPTQAESGVEADAEAQESVTVTVGVTDLNLAIDNENEHGVKAGKDTSTWKGETKINEESTIIYVAEKAKVGPDQTEYFVVDIEVSDLAGNVLQNFNSDVAADKTTYLPVQVTETGAVKYSFSMDRMRPNSSNPDDSAPVIEVTTPGITPTSTADGLELYNAAFNFELTVADGEDDGINAGLQYVKYTIVDKNGVVAAVDTTNSYANGETEETGKEEESAEAKAGEEAEKTTEATFKDSYKIPVAVNASVAGRKESNEVTLNIEAMDSVGNLITFTKTFAFDVEAPAVTITQSNHDVRNEFYFKADQVITIEVTELNFSESEAYTTVTSQVGFSGWTKMDGNTYRGTLTYNTDGDYTFEMATKDLANNNAQIDYETGLTAVQKFTIDKTAPVIRVDFNPFIAVDTDDMGVQYFDKERNVTVTITEHNFRAADVVSDLAGTKLVNWGTYADTHTASHVFREGNNYYVKVDYTDLAGNPAVGYTSPKFSVDLEAPAIEINKGSMSSGTLNIVPEDLILGFLVTDYQDNLKTFDVEVYHLDNNYQQTKVQGAEYYSITDGDRTTGYVDFTNIASEKGNDGIYTVRVSALDYAGHTTYYPDVVFSLNRFGSTFTVSDDYTSSFLTADGTGVIYQNEVEGNLVITEINPNRVWQDVDQTVEGSIITVAANGNSVTLVPGVDYEVTVTEKGTGNNKWYEYTYSINPAVFASNDELVDGDYTIFFYSEDEAGNKNTNESNQGSALQLGADGTYSGKVSFTLDHKAPVVTVLNIEEGGQYVEANKSVEINVADNTPVSIAVYINDLLVEYVESAEGQPLTSDWLTYDPITGNYLLNMCEKDEVQNVRVVVTDAAGNVTEKIVGDITLTENLWIQFINNEVLLIGSAVGGVGIILLIILLLRKRKKNAEAAAV